MPTAPIIEFRSDTNPFAVLSSIPLAGAGLSGAIVAGTSSAVVQIRIYNNFANTGGIHDAINCDLASYDDATHQGSQVTAPVSQQWLQVSVQSYGGVTTGNDGTTFFPIGGNTRHAIPVNFGVLAGAAPHYIQVQLKVVVPALASATSVTQGLWLEYDFV
jgi:hypothetical protein